jgi:hypothetical protein
MGHKDFRSQLASPNLGTSSGNCIIALDSNKNYLLTTTAYTSATTRKQQCYKEDKRSFVSTEPNTQDLIHKNLTSVDALDVACVYLLYRGKSIVYIGQSRNFYSRIQSHKKTKNFTHFRCLRCHPQRLDYWEGKLIFEYKPEYNKRGVNSREGTLVPLGVHDGKHRKLRARR